MTLAGWIFMGLYWGVIIALVCFCMKRVLMLDYRERRGRSLGRGGQSTTKPKDDLPEKEL